MPPKPEGFQHIVQPTRKSFHKTPLHNPYIVGPIIMVPDIQPFHIPKQPFRRYLSYAFRNNLFGYTILMCSSLFLLNFILEIFSVTTYFLFFSEVILMTGFQNAPYLRPYIIFSESPLNWPYQLFPKSFLPISSAYYLEGSPSIVTSGPRHARLHNLPDQILMIIEVN